MKRGRLNNRVTIQRAAATKDSHNEDVEGWADLASRWCAIVYGKGEERRYAAAESGSQSASFVMLADSLTKAITLKDRLVMAEDIWDIVGISPMGRGEIEFTAVRSL